MAVPAVPSSGLTLHGSCSEGEDMKCAILLHLRGDVVQDVKKASARKDGLRLMTGSAPKLLIGNRTVDLSISREAFRHELYEASKDSTSSLHFNAIISHRAETKTDRKQAEDMSGTDEALAALQSSLASYEQEKQSKQTNITNSLLPTPKNRSDAARINKQEMRSLLGSSRPVSPAMSAAATPRLGAVTVPLGEVALRTQAMKTPILHLLALRPTSTEDVVDKTHVPEEDLKNILQKIGQQVKGKWQLSDRAYKDLDVWKFGYASDEDRQLAIENAIRAYDRLRFGTDEKIWQMLLPTKDREKGIVLSKLHLSNGSANKGLTPQHAFGSMTQIDGIHERGATSAANTPRLGAITPRPGSVRGDVSKRLLSKNPKKAQAAEAAKEKKRKEREVAASDRESARPAKRQATKKDAAKAKSAEFVHSSEDESDEDVVRKGTRVESKSFLKDDAKTKVPPAKSPEKSDAAVKASNAVKKPAGKASVTPSVQAAKRPPTEGGNNTPCAPGSLPAPKTQQKPQRSPQKSDSKPSVPSPLGAARPRNASDVSERASTEMRSTSKGTTTPQALGITTNGARKLQDTVTSTTSITSSGDDKTSPETADRPIKPKPRPMANGTGISREAHTNGTAHHQGEQGTKRKADEATAPGHENGPAPKHLKTGPASSQSQNSHTSSTATARSTTHASPDALLDNGSSSDSAASVIDSITFTQGVNLAEKFRDTYYPAYAKMYDEQAAMEARGEPVNREQREVLLRMHKRLEQMKREITIASLREVKEE